MIWTAPVIGMIPLAATMIVHFASRPLPVSETDCTARCSKRSGSQSADRGMAPALQPGGATFGAGMPSTSSRGCAGGQVADHLRTTRRGDGPLNLQTDHSMGAAHPLRAKAPAQRSLAHAGGCHKPDWRVSNGLHEARVHEAYERASPAYLPANRVTGNPAILILAGDGPSA
jgi:hypothetical protein